MSERNLDDPYPNSEMFDPRQKKVHSDFVGGDKVGLGDISVGGGVAVGRDSQSGITTPLPAAGEGGSSFQEIYRLIRLRPDEPGVSRDNLVGIVRRIEEEILKREEASLPRLESWLEALRLQAPDIHARTLAALAGPPASAEVRRLALSLSGGQIQSVAAGGIEAMKQDIQTGPWNQVQKDRMVELIDELNQEMQAHGESADLGMIAHSLDEVVTLAPQMRSPLYTWLVDSPDIPRPVRIVARKFLLP